MSKAIEAFEWSKQISKGKAARLFPSLKTSNKEQIATSTLLAVFRLVPELFTELIKDAGVRITDKTTFYALTEVNLIKEQGGKKDRPDGYIYVKSRNEWSALVEAKVGKSQLKEEQILRYLIDARENSINALITISNEFSPRVDQSPIDVPKRLLNKVKLYHFSWRLILSKAQLLKNRADVEDREKSFVLAELIRFLQDDSVGEKSFSIMPAQWTEISKQIAFGSKLKLNDSRLPEISRALVEEFSEIALNLTDHLGVDCFAKLPSSFINDKTLWQKSIERSLSEARPINCLYTIPDAANSLIVEIDFAKSIFWVGMEIEAPKDKKTISGRVNWMRRQLKSHQHEDAFVKIRWNSRASDLVMKLPELMEDLPTPPSASTSISSFTPLIQIHSTRTFQSRKNFIIELEKAILKFYDQHGQFLKAWVPPAPTPIKLDEEE